MTDLNNGRTMVKTPCRLCRGQCGLRLHIEKNRIIRAQGDREDSVSRGYICPKGRAIPEIINAPDRLIHPLQRQGNRWKKISWQSAIQLIAERLQTAKEKYGAHATAIHMGLEGVIQDIEPLIMRFCNVYGTPNYSSASSQCYWAKELGNILTCGALPEPDLDHARCIMLWGTNPGASNPLKAQKILALQNQGARLIVVDPARTSMAERADLHLQVRPGTDGALALGMLNVIFQHNLHDASFTANWTIGLERLKALSAQYPPEKVEKITWIPKETIEQAARMYSRNRPGCILQGNALELHTNAIQAIRAIACLEAITGNLDVRGGGVMKSLPDFHEIVLKEMLPPTPHALGALEYPLFYKLTRNAQANMLADAILNKTPYPIKAMVITGANPVLTFPNAGHVKQALSKLDFLVVMEMFMTDTAEMADIVLPGAAAFERNELWGVAQFQSGKTITYANQVVPPPEECRPEWQFWLDLAKALGHEEYFPWDDDRSLYDYRLAAKGITVQQLKQQPGMTISLGHKRVGIHKKEGFQTPSGKVELYSQTMQDNGAAPLPLYEEPAESPIKYHGVKERYPLTLTSGGRLLEYTLSRYRNIPSLTQRVPAPWIEIHPRTAEEQGISDGDMVAVETRRGRIEVKAKVSGKIHPRVVRMATGWRQANVNLLTDDAALDPVSGYPPFGSLQCRITVFEGGATSIGHGTKE